MENSENRKNRWPDFAVFYARKLWNQLTESESIARFTVRGKNADWVAGAGRAKRWKPRGFGKALQPRPPEDRCVTIHWERPNMNEQAIFLAALDIADPAERTAYLLKTCAGNADLLRKVETLLAAHEKSGEFLNRPALGQMAGSPDATTIGNSSISDELDLSFLSPSPKPGSLGTLGHYEVLQVLGQGAFGTVLKAFDEKLHRLVAIKVLGRELAATSPPRKRFVREARSVAAIKHENVIAIYSVEEQPIPYFVMEFVDGSTLQDKMDEAGPLGVPEILHIGRQIASGLASAHALGLIHRDIKPANILLEKGVVKKVKITDFGLARTADDASMTQSGMIVGTPLYMAPEQAKGANLDGRADLFSLGSVLYALATGHAPFRARTAIAVLRRVADDTPRPIQEVISDVPDWLVAIVNKLLAKQPDDRFQSAQEVADLLAKCQAELQTTGSVKSIAGLTGPAVAPVPLSATKPVSAPLTPAPASVPATGTPPRARRQTGKWFLAGLLLLAIGGFLYPWLRLELAGRASFQNLTRDGDTHIEFLKNGQVIGEQTGYGLIELPAGDYDIRVTKSDTTLRIHNAIVTRRNWLNQTDTVALDTPPQKFALKAGERIEFTLAYTKSSDTASVNPSTAQSVREMTEYPPTFTNRLGIEFVKVPKGTGWLGGGAGKPGETKVEFAQDFYLGKYEVTQDEWEKVMGENPSHFSRRGEWKGAVIDIPDSDLKRFPVENVSWDQCQLFVQRINEKVNDPHWEYRLPTAAEWEYACRGGPITDRAQTGFDFYLDKPTDTLSADSANFSAGSGNRPMGPRRVGTYLPNPLGLFDMHGNVWEWCQNEVEPNPNDPERVVRRVDRGGGWDYGSEECRAIIQSANPQSLRGYALGLRLARVRAARPVTSPSTTPAQSERELAEWLLKQPGVELVLTPAEGKPLTLKTGDKLPDGEFFVGGLAWRDADEINNADLARIGSAQRLTGLQIWAKAGKLPNVTDKGLDSLFSPSVSKSLNQLIVQATFPNVTDDAYLVVNRAQSMVTFHFALPPEKGAFLAQLNLPKLATILMRGLDIPGGWLVPFSQRSRELTELSVQGARLIQADVQALAGMDLIGGLSIECGLEDESLTSLSKLSKLTSLNLSNSPGITDAGTAQLEVLKQLRDIVLIGCSVGDESCKTLATLDNLESVRLSRTRLTDKGVEALTSLKSLKRLELYDCNRLSDEGLESLARIGSLSDLQIQNNPQLTEAAVRKLQAALPKCRIVSDFGTHEPTRD